jgi:hypothetical protein
MSTEFKVGGDAAHEGEPGLNERRRDFLKGALAAGGVAASVVTVGVPPAPAQPGMVPGSTNHYYVPATDKTVHWGYFSKLLKPVVEIKSTSSPSKFLPITRTTMPSG